MVQFSSSGFWLWTSSNKEFSYKMCPWSQCSSLIQFSKYLLKTYFSPRHRAKSGDQMGHKTVWPWSQGPHSLNLVPGFSKPSLWTGMMSTVSNESSQPRSQTYWMIVFILTLPQVMHVHIQLRSPSLGIIDLVLHWNLTRFSLSCWWFRNQSNIPFVFPQFMQSL